MFNEMYAKDTSKKIRATFQAKGRSGERLCTIPPYGYMKDPENKKRWIVDEEAAAIVQKIFSLCVDGLGPTKIAKCLQQNEVLNPIAYFLHERFTDQWQASCKSLQMDSQNDLRYFRACGVFRQYSQLQNQQTIV